MRTPLSTFCSSVVIAFFFLLAFADAQQVRQPDTELVAPKKLKRTAPKKMEQEPRLKCDGSLTKAIQSGQPWQIVNPLAPSSYGTGEGVVSEDPDELGRGQGLLLFGVQW